MYNKKIGYEVRELALSLNRLMDKEAEKLAITNLKGPQAMVLKFIKDNPEKIVYQKDIEEELCIRKATASQLINRMEKNGFINRVTVSKDKRYRQLVITEQGKNSLSKIDHLIDRTEKKMKSDLSSEELTTFFNLLGKIKKSID